MRRHAQPTLQRCFIRWSGIICAIVVASASGIARTGFAAGNSENHLLSNPIEIASRSVKVWTEGDVQWLLLSGDVAIQNGGAMLRARDAVVRITRVELPETKSSGYCADVHAEGDVHSNVGEARGKKASSTANLSFVTSDQVRLSSARRSSLEQLSSAPKNSPILARSGLLQVNASSRAPNLKQAAVPRPMEPKRVETEVVPTQLVRSDTGGGAKGNSGAGGSANGVQLAQATSEPSRSSGADLPPIEAAPIVPNLNNAEDLPPIPDPLPGNNRISPIPGEGPPGMLGPGDEDEVMPGVEEELGEDGELVPLPGGASPRRRGPSTPSAPVLPGTQRTIEIKTRQLESILALDPTPEGVQVIIVRGGVNIIATTPQHGIVDLEADHAVIWRHLDAAKGKRSLDNGGRFEEDAAQPLEVYLEGHVIVRRDAQKFAGQGDQQTAKAERVYYDFVTDRMVHKQAELDLFAPGFIVPFKVKADQIDQFRPMIPMADGRMAFGQPEIRAEQSSMTGSRFPNPAYLITNRSIDLTRRVTGHTDPKTGKEVDDPNDPMAEPDLTWNFDARQNFFWMGWLPVFYWPRISGDIDDIEPPLRQLAFRSNNYFGQQVLADFNGFRLFGIKQPRWIDIWNVDVDYLSARTKEFPALGTELGWFGKDPVRDLTDPYHRLRNPAEHITKDYFGYLDIWGLKDAAPDNLGSGPAVITNGPPGAGTRGYQRSSNPAFQDFRGRFLARHMQRFIDLDDEERPFEDVRLQAETSYVSDRNFLEEYYKRLNETGLDQANLAYFLRQKNNWAWSVLTEGNFESFYTDTQWLPKLDYYRLGDSLFGNWINYSQHSGANYANTHTDNMVNNPNLFAYMPYDPISNTSGVFSAGRFYTNHEINVPLNLGNVVRITPYLQGQAVGWTDQLGGGQYGRQSDGSLGRIWGAAGAHAEVTAWKIYPWVESELWNVHGLNNKISLYADGRAAYSNVNLNQIAVQDDLDDNTYEYVRRYFAMTNYSGGLLPLPYDPRHLIMRRAISPITGTTDVQGTINTVQLGFHQRLQTKRGPEGKRRIVDYMTLDANTTFFPTPSRDNFGKPWGQTMYNWQWFIGDRTSIVSSGWFEFWKLVGSQPLTNYNVTGNDPFGLNTVTSGFAINRPPGGSFYLGYTVIDTGTLKTSAVSTSLSYWMSPKWYGTYSTTYDFGNGILLASMFSFTRIGADYLTSIGLTVDPQRSSYMFAVQITPRLSPNMRLGGGVGSSSFDSRFAPTQ